MSDVTFERILTIASCIFICLLIYFYYSIKNAIKQLDNVQTEQDLLEIKEIISSRSFNLAFYAILPFLFNLIFGFE